MMLDLYRLDDGFPAYKEACMCSDPLQRAQILEAALAGRIFESRFTPYIQVHEFEALILADPDQFAAEFTDCHRAIQELHDMLSRAASPEHINDGATTAPSKRITQLFPDFRKTVNGVGIARRIGIERMRNQCAHFHSWLIKLEQLAA